MFGSLRKKLNSAIREGFTISENLQQQYRQRQPGTPNMHDSTTSNRSSSSLSNFSTSDLAIPLDVNMAAGCNLLAHYEYAWQTLHDANEENANKAAAVAEQIDAIGQSTAAQRTVMADLCSCMGSVPALVAKLQASMETLQQVSALTVQVEEQLEKLENLCEECELQELMLLKQCELSQYKQKKMAELEVYRQRVAAEHQEKIRQHEQRLRKIQRERQAVFEDAFREDLEEYKQRGAIAKIYKTTSNAMPLEEVELEDTDTKDALEEFLNG